MIDSYDSIKVLLVCSKLSKAPAFIKLSTHFLFTDASAILSQKSAKSLNSPFAFRSDTISSTSPIPTYAAGTMGPDEAFHLLQEDGFNWVWQPDHWYREHGELS